MKKKGVYKIYKDRKLIVEYYSGDINIEDIVILKTALSLEQDFNSGYSIVLDFRECDLLITKEDVLGFISFLKENSIIVGKRKSAYLTTNPNEVVVATIFSTLIKNLPISPKIFTTTEAAVNWLGLDKINNQDLLEIIAELKSQSDNLYEK
jgi:hypothetical protein